VGWRAAVHLHAALSIIGRITICQSQIRQDEDLPAQWHCWTGDGGPGLDGSDGNAHDKLTHGHNGKGRHPKGSGSGVVVADGDGEGWQVEEGAAGDRFK
jgi:L-rhamnose isomerase